MHWRDFRESKRNGLVVTHDDLSLLCLSFSFLTNLSGDPFTQVKPRHPDFKPKDGHSLWLSKDNEWVLPKLKGLQFDVPDSISKKGLSV